MNWILYESNGITFTWVKPRGKVTVVLAGEIQALGAEWVKVAKSWVFYNPPDTEALTTIMGEPPAEVIEGVSRPPKKWPGASTEAKPNKEAKPTASTTSRPPSPTEKDLKLAARLRGMADKLNEKIEHKLNTFSNSNYTRRRAQMQDSARKDARSLQKLQATLYGLAGALKDGTVPPTLKGIKTKAGVERVLGWYEFPSGQVTWHQKSIDQLAKDGITADNFQEAKAALVGLGEVEDHSAEDEQWKREKDVRGLVRRIPGYFPTPTDVARTLVEWVGIWEGHEVLEPSAGDGAIADQIAGMHPEATLSVVELNNDLRAVLEGKGYELAGRDFIEYAQSLASAGVYDRIVMNPPFEKGQAFNHIQAAYGCLKEHGRLVSVMPYGAEQKGDKRSKDFLEWLETRTYYEIRELAEDAFKESGTGVRTQVILIDR